MRLLTCIAISAAAAAALIVAAPAGGQTPLPGGTDPSSVTVQGAQPVYQLDAKEFQDYRGTYLLSNGQRLTLSTSRKRFYATIDGYPQFEIVPVRHNTFVGRGNGLRMTFDEFHQSRTHDVVLTGPRWPVPASGPRLGAR